MALAATTTTATNHSIPASHPAVDVHFEHVATTGPPSTTHPGDEYQNDQGHHNHYNSHTYQHDGAHFAGASASSLISRGKSESYHKQDGIFLHLWFRVGVPNIAETFSPVIIKTAVNCTKNDENSGKIWENEKSYHIFLKIWHKFPIFTERQK